MSHGGDSGEVASPNLTPLLDMVLQLVMFFILSANFVMQDLNDTIKLPEAIAAVPLDSSVTDLLFLNVNAEGFLLPTDGDREPIKTPPAIRNYLTRRYQTAENARGKEGATKVAVVIRASEDATFDKIFMIMQSCRQVGFTRLQLRALKK